jgi:hypothetical protein
VKDNSKLLWLLLPVSFGAIYFPSIALLDTNVVAKEVLMLLPLQIAALIYVRVRGKGKG